MFWRANKVIDYAISPIARKAYICWLRKTTSYKREACVKGCSVLRRPQPRKKGWIVVMRRPQPRKKGWIVVMRRPHLRKGWVEPYVYCSKEMLVAKK